MNPTRFWITAALLAAVSLAAGCSGVGSEPTVDLGNLAFTDDVPPVPPIEQGSANIGRLVYSSNCTSCHGAELKGASDWKTPDEDGNYPPPPLDSSGHAWHHSTTLLTEIIRNGSAPEGSAMVGFRDRLSPAEIAAVVEYLRSTWGADEREFQWLVTWQERERGG